MSFLLSLSLQLSPSLPIRSKTLQNQKVSERRGEVMEKWTDGKPLTFFFLSAVDFALYFRYDGFAYEWDEDEEVPVNKGSVPPSLMGPTNPYVVCPFYSLSPSLSLPIRHKK